MRKNISVQFTNERIIPSGGLAIVGAILGKSDFVKRCNHSQFQIKNGNIILSRKGWAVYYACVGSDTSFFCRWHTYWTICR